MIQENNNQTQFQLIYPMLETRCQVFGQSSAIMVNNVTIPAQWCVYMGIVAAISEVVFQCPVSMFINKVVCLNHE